MSFTNHDAKELIDLSFKLLDALNIYGANCQKINEVASTQEGLLTPEQTLLVLRNAMSGYELIQVQNKLLNGMIELILTYQDELDKVKPQN